ncbi:hypothetical protein [Actinomadura sp. 7K534]|uniref:hypothetical protein n=1 Tax=Actinomadura sp. 7K534 TaxID=2530366 RepID=UPI00104AA110|nr:hypothetical protein [Actinomadura sp. 7K534]TDB92995.1 hypothetical protein E1266_22145 [Actinomadura sp. 7K534]
MRRNPLNTPTLITVTGLVTGAVGLLIQKVAGVDMPPVPPGLVILLVVAALIVMTRWRWVLVLAVLGGLAELPGAVGSALDADAFGEIAGAAVRTGGAAVALVAGVVALVTAIRSRGRDAEPAAR